MLETPVDVKRFCLSVTSIDGTYVSKNDYEIMNVPNNLKKFTLISYPTKYKDVMAGFNNQELAVLATVGSCQDGRAEKVLLTSKSNTNHTKILFMINSGRSEVFMQLKTAEGAIYEPFCKRIEQGKRTAYDTLCELESDRFLVGSHTATILRRKNGRTLPPTYFELKMSEYAIEI
jgi:hypothetical protein